MGGARTYLLAAGLFVFVCASPAFGADVGCGRDTDLNGSVDRYCPNDDADADGYMNVAGTHFATGFTDVDCGDNNFLIVPGTIDTAGCSANQFRRCKADGTWTSCANLSGATAADFSNDAAGDNLYFCDPDVTTDTGNGSFATPYNCEGISNSSFTNKHIPVAGDVIVVLPGTFTETYTSGSTRMWYFANVDGTSSNKIRVVFLNGAVFSGQGVSPTEVPIFQLENSDYWVIQGEHGAAISGGYSNAGISALNADDLEIFGMTVYDIDGESDNNLAGIKTDDTDRPFIHNNVAYGNYERANSHGINNAEIYVTEADAFRVIANTAIGVTGGYYGFKNKHRIAGTNAGSEFTFNFAINTYAAGIQFLDANIAVKRNFLHGVGSGGGLAITNNADGNGHFSGNTITRNTIINSSFLEFKPEAGTIGSPALTISGNIVSDNRSTSYPTDGTDGFIRVCHYCSNAVYSSVSGAFSSTGNCYHNQSAVALFFSYFGDTGSGNLGATYSSFANWVAAGFDSGTYNENPSFNAYGIATSTNCGTAMGWQSEDDEVELPPTPTPTPTPPPTAIGGGKGNRLIRGRR